MKKWVKIGTEVSGQSDVVADKSTAAYSRHYDTDSEKQAQLTEQLVSMTRAHNNNSASNKSIRNGFYGVKE